MYHNLFTVAMPAFAIVVKVAASIRQTPTDTNYIVQTRFEAEFKICVKLVKTYDSGTQEMPLISVNKSFVNSATFVLRIVRTPMVITCNSFLLFVRSDSPGNTSEIPAVIDLA